MWNVVCQGSCPEPESPGFLSGVSYISTLCLAHARIPNSQTEGRCSHKPYCLYKQLRHSELLFSSGSGETPPQIQVPRYQPGANLASRHSQESSLSSVLLALFHTASQIGWRKDGIPTLLKLINISLPGHLHFPPRKRSTGAHPAPNTGASASITEWKMYTFEKCNSNLHSHIPYNICMALC